MMRLLSSLMLAAPLVLQIAAVEGSSIARAVEVPAAAAGETDLAAIIQDPTDFLPDGKTCCPSGQEPAAYAAKNNRCEYGSHVSAHVSLSDDKVKICCFNVRTPKFHVHYLDLDKGLKFPVDVHGSLREEGKFCNLGLKYDISEANVADNWISLGISLSIDCLAFKKSAKEWITIFFNKEYHHSGKFTYAITPIGPTIFADVAAKIMSDNIIGLQFHVTALGLPGKLDQKVDVQIENDTLKSFLKGKEICA